MTNNSPHSPTQPLLRPKVNNTNECVAPNYKPRYQVEETKKIEDNHDAKYCFCLPKSFSPMCIISTLCCCNCCFLRNKGLPRRKVLFVVIILSFICVLVNIHIVQPLTTSLNFHSFALAKKQSYGLFDDVPHMNWKHMQDQVHEQRKKQREGERASSRGRFANLFDWRNSKGTVITTDPSHYSDVSQFYQNHWHAEFTCPHEERIGYDEARAKYVCDPRRIGPASQDRHNKQGGNSCIIYTSAANVKDFSFEKSLVDAISQGGKQASCEVHVFSPNEYIGSLPEGVQFHSWGFSTTRLLEEGNNDKVEFKTITDTLQTLGHCGKTIDILSIDCEGCEFDIYNDFFLNSNNEYCPHTEFMQILVQVHGAPSGKTNDFFENFQRHNYVVFHKEARSDSNENEQEYGFLKLSSDFFI